MKKVAFGSFTVLATTVLAASVAAQEAPLPPPPGGFQDPNAPAAAQPQPPAPAPDPNAPVAPGVDPNAPPGPPPPALPQSGEAGVQGSVGAEFGATAEGAPEAANGEEEAAAPDSETTRRYRETSLQVHNGLYSSTGLMRVLAADSGAAGTFRVSLLTSYFSGSGFLCGEGAPCGGLSDDDDVQATAARLGVSATLWPFLEASLFIHNRATSNTRGRPELLQVLGDTNLGVKAFTPWEPNSTYAFGGLAELWLLNGSGSVGLDGGSTSFKISGLATADFDNQTREADRVPVRAHLNVGYFFNNSGKIVDDIEAARKAPVSRIQRFGLGINRVDSLQIGLGGEFITEMIRPFVEWTIDMPVNRQSYVCNVDVADVAGDGCLGNDAGFSTSPSRLTLGARVYPWEKHGLALTAAADIGTGATSAFIEEVSPELPWSLHLGLAYAADTETPAPIIQRVPVQSGPPPAPPENYIAGIVVDSKTREPVPNVIVRYDGPPLTGMVSGADGTFKTGNLPAGAYNFNLTVEGYRPASCAATIPVPYGPGAASGPVAAAPPSGDPNAAGAAPVGPSIPPPAGGPGQPAAPVKTQAGGAQVVNVECPIEALPAVGNVVGALIDAESSAPVGGASVKITDKLNRQLELAADAAGSFRFENVPPGTVTISATAEGYLPSVTEIEVRARSDVRASLSLNKRPEKPNVVLTNNELKLKKQVHFENASAALLPDSMAILGEIADMLTKHPELTLVEIQGHTDDAGTPPYNLRLSQNRAEAVRDALTRLGVDSSRMESKGYGQSQPLVPNVTEDNKARNRRVQIIIKSRQK